MIFHDQLILCQLKQPWIQTEDGACLSQFFSRQKVSLLTEKGEEWLYKCFVFNVIM